MAAADMYYPSPSSAGECMAVATNSCRSTSVPWFLRAAIPMNSSPHSAAAWRGFEALRHNGAPLEGYSYLPRPGCAPTASTTPPLSLAVVHPSGLRHRRGSLPMPTLLLAVENHQQFLLFSSLLRIRDGKGG